jgi:hypothetical protein
VTERSIALLPGHEGEKSLERGHGTCLRNRTQGIKVPRRQHVLLLTGYRAATSGAAGPEPPRPVNPSDPWFMKVHPLLRTLALGASMCIMITSSNPTGLARCSYECDR